ncbi:MAG TPA: BadF/BadG/BcrA/BcrD ATPase family protein [Armatimonadota bacterium]|nr:BadF/BadG/BcrA/BcrD ATPase family protein [Armatimonadota bacterium]HOS42675.1 BadF/BadG/BcrA/BcrD ATPase family protein [Armatimonadota bacterium]
MRCVLGIDGGGSKCDALLVREDGVALGWGHADVRDPRAGKAWQGSGRSQKTISLAGYLALKRLDGTRCDDLHISSVSGWLPLGFWRRQQVGDVHVHVVQEYEAALTLIGEEYGAVALAGTGALIHIRARDDRRIHLDGLGPFLGDRGGGHQVGYHALRAASIAQWGPRHATTLEERVYQSLEFTRRNPGGYSLIGIFEKKDRAEIAALAKIVDEEAEAGDRIAREILERAAGDLAETFADAVAHLGVADDAYAIACTGGMMRSRIYFEHFCRRAANSAPGFTPVRSDLPAVAGIALPTLYAVSGADPKTLYANLHASVADAMAASAASAADAPEPTVVYGPDGKSAEISAG